jgi:hypothetical protein
MDGWMDEWIDVWMDGWVVRCMDRKVHGCLNGYID